MELTTYNEEVFSISLLFSSNIFPVEKPQNASFDSNPGGGGTPIWNIRGCSSSRLEV